MIRFTNLQQNRIVNDRAVTALRTSSLARFCKHRGERGKQQTSRAESAQGRFVERDASVVDRYFSPDLCSTTHPSQTDPGAIANLVPTLKEDLSYEVGMVVAEGDIVMFTDAM
jgi:hypothetical protein